MKIGTLEVGEGHPCALVAELGNAANGDFNRAIRLLDAAKESGASAAKLQCYTPDELIALRGDGKPPAPWDHMTMRELYTKAMTPREWFPKLFDYADSIGLPLFSSVFGMESFEFLESCGNPAYKLAALDFGNTSELVGAIRNTGKPLIQSCPLDHAPWDVPYPVYAPPGYPQKKAKLRNIRNGYWGYSYHGIDWETPFHAVIAGAHFVEFHFELDGEPSELEADVSLGEYATWKLVGAVRAAEEFDL